MNEKKSFLKTELNQKTREQATTQHPTGYEIRYRRIRILGLRLLFVYRYSTEVPIPEAKNCIDNWAVYCLKPKIIILLGEMVVLTNFLAPTEGIKHQQPSTSLFVNSRDVGVGTLYITER